MLTKKLIQSLSTAAFLMASLSALAAPFSQAPLPYAADALEPVIDAKTMEFSSFRFSLTMSR
jgi:Fe-Mn family superoxide dismutase